MRTVLHYCIEEWPQGATAPARITDGIVTIEGHDPSDWRRLLLSTVADLPELKGANPKHLALRSLTVLKQTS